METAAPREVPALARLQQRALIVGVVALLAGAVGAVMNVDQFFRSWLIGFLFCLSLSLGSLALLMLQDLSGGQWGMGGRGVFGGGHAASADRPVPRRPGDHRPAADFCVGPAGRGRQSDHSGEAPLSEQ